MSALLLAAALAAGGFAAAPAAPGSFPKALSDYRDGRKTEALSGFLLVAAEQPGTKEGEESLRYVWEIASSIKKAEQSLVFDPASWRETVATAAAILQRRRLETGRILGQVESLARDLPSSSDPLGALRRAPLWIGTRDQTRLDELSRLKADQHLAAIRQALKALAQRGAPDASELHEVKGYLWLFQGDLELALQEWRKALRLRPPDPALEERAGALAREWETQKVREEAAHELALGIGAYKAGRFAQAYKQLLRAQSLSPADPEAARYLALVKEAAAGATRQEKIESLLTRARQDAQAGLIFEAVQGWVDALVLDPGNQEARRQLERTRNRLLVRQTETPPAEPTRPKPAAAESSRQGEESYSLGLIYYNDGELEKARVAFNDALRFQPQLKKARRALEQVEAELRNR